MELNQRHFMLRHSWSLQFGSQTHRLTPRGCDCIQVIRGTTGFDIIELHSDTDDTHFAYRVVAKRKGFEEKRPDVCVVARADSYLYPELREKERRDASIFVPRLMKE